MGTAHSNEASSLERLQDQYDKQFNRQIVLLDHYWQQKRATEIARRKEMLMWDTILGCTAITTLMYQALKLKIKALIIPVIPMVTYLGYRITSVSDDYINLTLKSAEEILHDPTKKDKIRLAGGRITLQEIDQRRKNWENL
ncbi:unnamed protein product [Bursaphelenchus okinawaensis]|uniref:Uncharacterized protein n=1 Tax=Bursaphelenchus okinawaensis TaxID=465554 RepID=A0A811K6B1_9BILA|nr:unnamed protein product [Bursaphelenchus okinawaensis]CAG9093047.1 unnamed protein product [Bursaphelenchus okinawaensis]